MYFPQEEYEDRWARTYAAMKEAGFEQAIVWGRTGGTHERCADVIYLTNYYSSVSGQQLDSPGWSGSAFSAVILGDGEVPEVVGDMLDYPLDLLPTDRLSSGRDVIAAIADAVKRRRFEGPVALVGEDCFPVKYHRMLVEQLPMVELVAVDDLVQKIRRRKSPRELDCYREAGPIVSGALHALMETAVRGGTQAEAAAAGAAELIRNGGIPHMIPIASGEGIYYFSNSPLTGSSSEIELREGELVRSWLYGPIWQGYWCDPGRTAVVGGKPSSAQRDLIRAANHLVTELIEAAAPGTTIGEVTQLGNRLREETGTDEDQPGKMWPAFGHGLGLYFEKPEFSFEQDEYWKEELYDGQVLGLEVFLHRPGVGSSGLEQNFIVREGGNELLTTTELEWW